MVTENSTDDSGETWVSSAKRSGTSKLLVSLAVSDGDGRIILRRPSMLVDAQASIKLASGYELRLNSYKHEWFKDWDRHGTSKLEWSAFAIDGAGAKVTWENVEVAAHASTDVIPADHMQQEYYDYLHGPLADFSVYWHKEGADSDFQSAAKCYLGGWWYLWTFGSHA